LRSRTRPNRATSATQASTRRQAHDHHDGPRLIDTDLLSDLKAFRAADVCGVLQLRHLHRDLPRMVDNDATFPPDHPVRPRLGGYVEKDEPCSRARSVDLLPVRSVAPTAARRRPTPVVHGRGPPAVAIASYERDRLAKDPVTPRPVLGSLVAAQAFAAFFAVFMVRRPTARRPRRRVAPPSHPRGLIHWTGVAVMVVVGGGRGLGIHLDGSTGCARSEGVGAPGVVRRPCSAVQGRQGTLGGARGGVAGVSAGTAKTARTTNPIEPLYRRPVAHPCPDDLGFPRLVQRDHH